MKLGVYVPDLDAIARNQIPIVANAGISSVDAYYVRTTGLIVERLDCPYVEFPSNHFGYRVAPQSFVARLREVLRGFTGSKAAIQRVKPLFHLSHTRCYLLI